MLMKGLDLGIKGLGLGRIDESLGLGMERLGLVIGLQLGLVHIPGPVQCQT